MSQSFATRRSRMTQIGHSSPQFAAARNGDLMWYGREAKSGRKSLRHICRLFSLAVGRVEMILGVTLQFVREAFL
jgi:hypothetical protein